MNKSKQIPKLVKELVYVYNQNDNIDDKNIVLVDIKLLMNQNLKRMRKID